MRLTVNFGSVPDSTATMIRLSVEDRLSLVFSYLTINFDWYDAFQQIILEVLRGCECHPALYFQTDVGVVCLPTFVPLDPASFAYVFCQPRETGGSQ